VLGFSFLRSTRFISDGACDDGGCPRACATTNPQPVAAAPWPRRAVAAVPRSGVVAAAPRSRGRAIAGPLCGPAAVSPGPRGDDTSKAGEQATPLDVRVATATHEVRCSSDRRHGRHEVRTTMIARDILWPGAVWAARVTTYICACVIDDVLRPLPHPIRVFFPIIVFYVYRMYYLR
jgi:hypothetical protein